MGGILILAGVTLVVLFALYVATAWPGRLAMHCLMKTPEDARDSRKVMAIAVAFLTVPSGALSAYVAPGLAEAIPGLEELPILVPPWIALALTLTAGVVLVGAATVTAGAALVWRRFDRVQLKKHLANSVTQAHTPE